RETSTMPGYAGSSWYFLRYMDPGNATSFCDRKASDYWRQVDVYVGGTEHAVGHLLYSRMWTKFLYDRGWISFDEPFKKLVNQGMITGVSEKLIRANKNDIDEPSEFGKQNSVTSATNTIWINWMDKPYSFHIDRSEDFYIIQYSKELQGASPFGESEINVPIEFVVDGVLDVKGYSQMLKEQRSDFQVYVCKEGYFNSKYQKWFNFKNEEISPLEFRTLQLVEKMSKSKRNVVNPDTIIHKYGADTFRMYEMFLGPVEQSKPWDTKGIEGVHRFLKKLWRLFFDELKGPIWTALAPSPSAMAGGKVSDAEWTVLHKTIKKIEQDTENFAFNTAVSAFMVCVNELTDLKCHKKEVLEKLLVLLVPYAPHITEELWKVLGNEGTILDASYPVLNEKFLVESSKEYPISINGKMRTTINISLDADPQQVEAFVLENETIQKWLEGKAPKKIIFVKGKMVNVVI
ncbi:MAG: class I tRNA ligase family protein, partial [Ferruginibacter sp.]